MPKHDIVFIIAKATSSFFHLAEEDASASTLLYYLGEYGIEDIAVFPEKEEDKYIANYLVSLDKFLSVHSATLYCLTCWTDGFAFALDAAKLIRKHNPEALIVAGGPHFFALEEIGYTLNTGLVDIVFKGGGEPFLKFANDLIVNKKISMSRNEGKIAIKGYIPPRGVYVAGTKITNNGSGHFPYPVVPLVGVLEDSAEIRTMLNDSCPNGCDYCVIEHSKMDPQYTESLIDWVGSIAKDIRNELGKKTIFSLSDSSPFSFHNRKNTIKFLRQIKNSTSVDGMNLFLDPMDIDEEFYRIVDEFDINTFFVGRDRVSEDPFIGRRYHGALRTTSQLDDEKNRLSGFIDFLSGRKKALNQEVYLGYILSPYEKEADATKMINEIVEFSLKSTDKVRVQSNIFILNPYPGTRVAKRAEGDFIPMRYFYAPYPNVWVGKDCVNILIEMTRHIVAKIFCTKENASYYKPLFHLAHCIQYGSEFDYSLINDIENDKMKGFISAIVDKILNMGLDSKKSIDDYFDNVLQLYYLGCELAVVNHRVDLIGNKGLLDRIKLEDKVSDYLKKDFDLIKSYINNGKAPYYERYLHCNTI